MNVRYVIAVGALASLVGCARSGEGLSQQQEDQLNQATDDASTALQNSEDNATAIEELDGRVDSVEEAVGNGGGTVQDQITDLEQDIIATQEDVQDLEGRVDMLEDKFPVQDDEVVVDDRAAAGFPEAAPIDNVEQGFTYLNQRLDGQTIEITELNNEIDQVAGAVTTLEVSFQSDLFTTVQNVINQQVNEGNITVQTDLSFNAAPDVNPMDNTFGVKQYGDSENLEDAIRALRYANQSKYIQKTANTRLGALARPYVQEAIDKLDTDLYDVIYGNLNIDLGGGATVDGTDLDVYIVNAVQTDAVTQYIVNSTYFNDAVTNIIAGGGLVAADIPVETTLFGNPAAYANVQISLETLYARVGAVEQQAADNAADIASLQVDVAGNSAAIVTLNTTVAGHTTQIGNLVVDVNANTTNIAGIVNGANTATTNLYSLQQEINNLVTNVTNVTNGLNNLAAVDVPFNNTAHPAFDNNNNTNNVQVAIEDLHEESQRLNDALAAIAAGGGQCEDGVTPCTADAQCVGIGAGTCTYAVIDASNVIYNDNGQNSVRDALDDLYTSIVAAQTIVNDGAHTFHYIFEGQDINIAVQDLDEVLYQLSVDLTAAEAAITDLQARVAVLEARMDDAEADIASNAADIAANAADIAANAAGIAGNTANIANNTTNIANNTTNIANNTTNIANNTTNIANNTANIATNAANIANNAADIADNTADIATNAGNIANNAADIADNAANITDLDTRLTDVEGRLAVLENLANNFASYAFILGPSAQTEDGRFEFGGETGIRAATAMCQASYTADANAHLCTVAEVQQAIAMGNYANAGTIDNVKTWTMTGLSRRHGTVDAFTNADSRRTSCLDFLYNSGDQATGTSLTVRINEPSFGNGGIGIAGDMIDIRPNEPCAQTGLPVLCCR